MNNNITFYTKRHIFLITSFIVVLSMYIYIVYSNYTSNRNFLLNSAREKQIQLVKAYKSKIDEKLLQKKRIIKSTANYIKKKDRVNDYLLIKETLALAIRSGNFRSVYIGYYDDYFITGINWVAPSWYKVTKREWYKEVIKSKQIVVTKPYLDSDLDSNVVSIATPIFKDDKLFAVLSSDIKIDDFRYDILSLMPVKEGFAFMMSKSGDVILRPKEFGFDIEESYLKRINSDFLDKSSGVKTYKIKDNNYIFTYDSLENSDWIFITVLDEKKIYERLNKELFKNLLIAGILMVIGIIAFAYLSSTQRTLIKNRNLLDLFAKSSSWGVLMTDKEGRVVFVNKIYERIFSLKHKIIYDKNIIDVSHMIKNKEFFNNDKHFFINAKNNPDEIFSYKLQSEDKVYNFQVTPLLKANKIFEGVIVTVNDITRETQVEKDRLKQEKIFIQNSKMIALGEMVSAISHQWKQPLSTLLLLVSNIEEKIANKDLTKVDDYLIRSRSNIELMSETIEAFRDFYKEGIEEKEFDIVETIDEIIYIISPLVKMRGVDISFYYNKNDNYTVFGFSTYLKQVLINLISNSKDSLLSRLKEDAFYEAQIDIYLEKRGSKIYIRVEDNGDGIDVSKIDNIFDPLFTTKGKSGTGTGLHLCKLLVEDKMHGKIFLQSNKNPTAFVIELKEKS